MTSLPFVVYLLCFDRLVDGLKHYVGITTTARLQARMLEHQAGKGARLTSRAQEQGVGFALAALWPCASPHIEHVVAGTPYLSTQCSRCMHGDYWVQYPAKKKRPIPGGRPLILDWARISLNDGNAQKTREKEGQRPTPDCPSSLPGDP